MILHQCRPSSGSRGAERWDACGVPVPPWASVLCPPRVLRDRPATRPGEAGAGGGVAPVRGKSGKGVSFGFEGYRIFGIEGIRLLFLHN